MESIYETIGYVVAKLSRYSYWRDQLYRKLKGRENIDRAEIETAFLNKVLFENGIYTASLISWTNLVSKDESEKYLKKYDDIWKDYINWQWSQR